MRRWITADNIGRILKFVLLRRVFCAEELVLRSAKGAIRYSSLQPNFWAVLTFTPNQLWYLFPGKINPPDHPPPYVIHRT